MHELPLLYLDDDFAVVNKPSGLLVHRGWGRDEVVALTLLRDQLGRYVYPVHRLDRGTSGALLFALSPEAARAAQECFQSEDETRRAEKRYLALVRGITPEKGVIDSPVPRTPKSSRAPQGERVPALTEYRRLGTFEWRTARGRSQAQARASNFSPNRDGNSAAESGFSEDFQRRVGGKGLLGARLDFYRGLYSLVEALPRTGRPHQIRRHLKHITHPLIGDVRYGKGEHNRLFRERFGLHRLALHAWRLELPHPFRDERLEVMAPLPEDLAGPFEAMGLMQVVEDQRRMVAGGGRGRMCRK